MISHVSVLVHCNRSSYQRCRTNGIFIMVRQKMVTATAHVLAIGNVNMPLHM